MMTWSHRNVVLFSCRLFLLSEVDIKDVKLHILQISLLDSSKYMEAYKGQESQPLILHSHSWDWKTRWPNGYHAGLWIDWMIWVLIKRIYKANDQCALQFKSMG